MKRINWTAGRTALVILGALAAATVIHAQGNSKTEAANSSPTTTQNVNVVNTPTVNIGTPTVSVGNTPNVKLVNTTANPVPTVDLEKVARIPYQRSTVPFSCAAPHCTAQLTTSQVPAGFRLVLQHVSALVGLLASTTEAPVMDVYPDYNPNHGHWILAGKNGPTLAGGIMSAVNEDILAYFDPTDNALWVDVYGNTTSAQVTVTGYLENCAVTGCPAIQR